MLTHGVNRHGRSVIFMPAVECRFTLDEPAASIAYVKPVPVVDRTVPAMSVGPMAWALGLFVDSPLASASLRDHSQRLASMKVANNLPDEQAIIDGGCRRGWELPA